MNGGVYGERTSMSALRVALLTCASFVLLAPPAAAIVGGQEAADGEYPHMAALEFRGEGESKYEFNCGASLVAPDVVLTAAHCVDAGDEADGDSDTYPASSFQFLLGTNERDTGGERIVATEVREHPDYDEDGGISDVALLKLQRASTLGRPIAMAQDADAGLWQPGDDAIVTGWGRDAFIVGETSNELREVTVPIVDDTQCQIATGALLFPFDPDRQVCAGEDTGGADSCQGDSGGPLQVMDAAGAWKQVGVVSYGNGCGYPTQYGVYAQVGAGPLRTWVQDTARAMSTADSSGTDTSGGDTSTPTDGGKDGSSTQTASTDGEPAGSPAPGAAPQTTATPVITAPLAAKLNLPRALGSIRKARRRGAFRIGLRFNVPVSIQATLKQRGRTIARGSRRALRSGTLRLRLVRGARIRRGRAVLSVVVTDAQARRYTARRTVTLRR